VTDYPVEAVWVWRFTRAPYKATYGRLPGTTYTKDFLQAIGECAEALDDALQRGEGEAINLRFEWPGGSRDGSLFEAADYDENGRLDLRWETDNSPDPWRLYPDDDENPVKTFPGDPTHRTEADANREFALFQARGLDPWLVVVKLFGEPDVLHARAYLGNPPPGQRHTSTDQLPERVLAAMSRVPTRGGCAVVVETASVTQAGSRERILFDPFKIHDAWSVLTMDAASFQALLEERRKPAPASAGSTRRPFSTTYRPANTKITTSAAKVFTRDPDEVDRGLRGHNVTQEKLADLVRAQGLTPGSSVDANCDYDLAWERAGMVYVAEIKSLTNQNERLQLRLGFGQVLYYAHRLRADGWTVQPVLAVERKPSDGTWLQVCEEHGVRLVWPENMDTLF
jgi:hypothetical protein